MNLWRKAAAAIGSATPDPEATSAASQPLPPPVVSNKPAPGQTGPRGLSPRTTYTRVNTGAPPVPDAGSSGQKSQSPRGLEFLPAKVAHKESSMSDTTMFQRPSLQDLVKEAMEGTVQKVDINLEAVRQLHKLGASSSIEKRASAPQLTPTDYITKLAGALDYLAKQAAEGTAEIQPGKGPGALEVSQATSSGENIDAGQLGQAISADVPPKNPPMQSSGVAKDPANAMQTNDEMMHGEQPVNPMGNEKTSALYHRNLQKLGFSISPEGHAYDAEVAKAVQGANERALLAARAYEEEAPHKASLLGIGAGAAGLPMRVAARNAAYQAAKHEKGQNALNPFGGYLTPTPAEAQLKPKREAEKTSSVYARNLVRLGLSKLAEDAIDPAQISAGPAPAQGAQPPPGASASEEQVPPEPGDVNKQKNLIDSNQAAIDYTKGEAKSDPKSDVNKVLNEPALSEAHDKTLAKALDSTQQAGVKISHDLTKTAAAQALLYKLAEEVCGEKNKDKKKEKQSQMAGLSNPSGQSGFSASSIGM